MAAAMFSCLRIGEAKDWELNGSEDGETVRRKKLRLGVAMFGLRTAESGCWLPLRLVPLQVSRADWAFTFTRPSLECKGKACL